MGGGTRLGVAAMGGGGRLRAGGGGDGTAGGGGGDGTAGGGWRRWDGGLGDGGRGDGGRIWSTARVGAGFTDWYGASTGGAEVDSTAPRGR